MQTDKRIGGLPPADPEAHTMSLEHSPGRGGVPGCGVRPHPQDEEHSGQSGFYTKPQHEIRPAPYIKIYPILGMRAAQAGEGRSFQVWSAARHLDRSGSGYVKAAALLAHLRRVAPDVKEDTRKRWLGRAAADGWLTWNKDGLILKGAAGVCRLERLHMNRVGRAVEIRLGLFWSASWKTEVWAGVQKQFQRPVSRQYLQGLTGVPRRTQIRYERSSGVTSTLNFARPEPEISADHIEGLRETRPGAKRVEGSAGWQLPNTYHTPDRVRLAPPGRKRHIQRAMNYALSNWGREVTTPVRVFFASRKAARKGKGRDAYAKAVDRGGYAIWVPS